MIKTIIKAMMIMKIQRMTLTMVILMTPIMTDKMILELSISEKPKKTKMDRISLRLPMMMLLRMVKLMKITITLIKMEAI